MLKAHSKLLEHIMLAGDLLVVAACWLLAYVVRFYVLGPPLRAMINPPLALGLGAGAPRLNRAGPPGAAHRPRRVKSRPLSFIPSG